MKKKYVRFEYKLVALSKQDAISTSVIGTDNGKDDLTWQTLGGNLNGGVGNDV